MLQLRAKFETAMVSWPSGLGNYFVCKGFAVQTLLWSLEFVIRINLEHDTIANRFNYLICNSTKNICSCVQKIKNKHDGGVDVVFCFVSACGTHSQVERLTVLLGSKDKNPGNNES